MQSACLEQYPQRDDDGRLEAFASRPRTQAFVRVRLVVNPRARRALASGDAVRAALALRGVECVRADDHPSGLDAIVVVGGDGTVVSQIAFAIANDLPIGVVPLGTFNDMARTLGIPFAIDAACDTIAVGVTRAIDVGRVNGKFFVNEASIGVSARIARRQTPEAKRRFGVPGIIATTLQVLTHVVPFGVSIVQGDSCERFRSIQLTIANSDRFGSIWYAPDAAIDDGRLELYSVEFTSFPQALHALHGLLWGRGDAIDGLRRRSGTRFEVVTRRRHHIVADGEPAGYTPACFELLPLAVRVFAPP
jgi:YegS/Rv2252/BmrU family lipid kinase